jgi:Na+:H+ antiporter, NhaA family
VSRRWRDALQYYPLLPCGALAAIVWANTASDSYFRVAQALAFPVNDIGVAFGFAWLAQEVLEATATGGLTSMWRSVLLSIILAIGGTAGAAAVYAMYIHFTDERILLDGWRMACGVDVFFCIALARLIFRRGIAVRVVVLSAIVSNVIALIVVSRRPFVETGHPPALILIILALALSVVLDRFGVRSMWAYLLFAGPLSWLGCYWAGVHPALGLLPVVPFFPRSPRALDDLRSLRHQHARRAHFEAVFATPMQVVAFFFGLTNAGVLLRGVDTGTWAVLTASVVGRPAGVLIAAVIAGATGVPSARLVQWRDLVVIALIGSVGLVFALFLSTSVFPVGPLLAETKLGAIATLVGGVIAVGAARLLRVGRFGQALVDV